LAGTAGDVPSPELLLLAAAILAATYCVFGLTGAGSTVLALPLLVQFLPLKFAVSLLLLLDCAAGLVLISRTRQGVRMDELGRFLPFVLLGIGVGLVLLIKLPEAPLLTALGVFLLAYAGYGLLKKGKEIKISRAWSGPIGVTAGGLSALFGTGGVLMSLYVAGRVQEKNELRPTVAAAVLFNSGTRVVLFGATGLLTEGLMLSALWLLPSMLIGLFIGQRLHAAVSAAVVLRAVYAVLLVAGASLLVRSAGGA
jgi:hypothetical protein